MVKETRETLREEIKEMGGILERDFEKRKIFVEAMVAITVGFSFLSVIYLQFESLLCMGLVYLIINMYMEKKVDAYGSDT